MRTSSIDQLCNEMSQLNINKEPDNKSFKKKSDESDKSDDDSPSYQVSLHYKSISSDDESHTSPFYPLEK